MVLRVSVSVNDFRLKFGCIGTQKVPTVTCIFSVLLSVSTMETLLKWGYQLDFKFDGFPFVKKVHIILDTCNNRHLFPRI